MKEWQKTARELFFEEHKKIGEIAEIVQRSRKTVSAFLNSLDATAEEKERRKEKSKEARKQYQRRWDMLHRNVISEEDEQRLMRRSHDVAASVLSAERFFHE